MKIIVSSIICLDIVNIDTRFKEYLIKHLMDGANISWKNLNEKKMVE